jgi:glycosyltransferase involved in cell wall biosynthesis
MTISTADFATDNLVKEGVPRSKIVTIKNGSRCPEGLTESEKTKLCKELNIRSDALIIGSSARLEEVKGQDLILRAAPGIIKSFPRAVFLFLGDGSRRDEYMRLSASLGIEKNVRFIGYVENPAPYQNLFYVNVNSSRGTETSCLAISECMALGIPTVASSFGGNTEMIKDGECGLIFPTDNHFELQRAVLRLLSDGELHKKLSFGARRRYEDLYSTERMANDYKKLYLSLGNLRDKNTFRPKKQVKNASL